MIKNKSVVLVTGSVGFIGAALVKELINDYQVVGVDNHNNYYDQKLKSARLNLFKDHPNYSHYKVDISNTKKLSNIFNIHKPKYVVNLAAQAGVRYSIENPKTYIKSNIDGFLNILEECKTHNVEHLIYASSSSVYGANEKLPFSSNDNVDHPISVYAATKKSNELMAHVYSHLFELPSTGLRFFTVYGPWGRPDMALFKFTDSIIRGKQINVYNYGNHKRDFTYIRDVVDVLTLILKSPPLKEDANSHLRSNFPDTSRAPWRIYNVGSNNPYELLKYIEIIEENIGKKANLNFQPMQPGDVHETYADISNLQKDFNYSPSTSIEDGIFEFVKWYKKFYAEN